MRAGSLQWCAPLEEFRNDPQYIEVLSQMPLNNFGENRRERAVAVQASAEQESLGGDSARYGLGHLLPEPHPRNLALLLRRRSDLWRPKRTRYRGPLPGIVQVGNAFHVHWTALEEDRATSTAF